MSPDSLGILAALVVSLGTAVAGAITAWRRAPADNIVTLQGRLRRAERREAILDDEVEDLSEWRIWARGCLRMLRETLAANGLTPPAFPPEPEIRDHDNLEEATP
ncbi:hypothetical protein SEA_PUPPERS_24 [Gordonia phage Puppers]|nr:hypothetical protein SEA_PUPPERS_24 [Gordonia phage Puppers]